MKTEREFLELCARVLRVPVGGLSLETSRDDLTGWDSIAHLRLVMEAEAAFGCELPLARIPDIRTLGELFGEVVRPEKRRQEVSACG